MRFMEAVPLLQMILLKTHWNYCAAEVLYEKT